MRSSALRALGMAVLATGLIWALSPALTGRTEPWDAEGPYYPIALAVAGLAAGGVVPRPLWAHFVGSWLGPLAYQALFLAVGPLFLLGAALSVGYSIVFTLAAAIGAVARSAMERRTSEKAAWQDPASED